MGIDCERMQFRVPCQIPEGTKDAIPFSTWKGLESRRSCNGVCIFYISLFNHSPSVALLHSLAYSDILNTRDTLHKMARRQRNKNKPPGSSHPSTPAISRLSTPGGSAVYSNPTRSSLTTGPSKRGHSLAISATWDSKPNTLRLRDAACLDTIRGTDAYHSLLTAYRGIKDATIKDEWLNDLRRVGSESGLDVKVFTDDRVYQRYLSRHGSLTSCRTDFTNPNWPHGQPTNPSIAVLPTGHRSEKQNTEGHTSDRNQHPSAPSELQHPQQESTDRCTTTTRVASQTPYDNDDQSSASQSQKGSVNHSASGLQSIFGAALYRPFIPKHPRRKPAPDVSSPDDDPVDGYTSEPGGYHEWEDFPYGPPETYANQGPGPGRRGLSKEEWNKGNW
jgi:hypothetical protein